MPHLIDVPAAVEALSSGRPVRVLDVRWRLDEPEGRPAYLAGHLPGAVYVDLEHELADAGHPEEGRHPLPALPALEAAARRWGIRAGDLVIVYDDNDGVAAARAWWLLRRRGVDIRVLDGGLAVWKHARQLLDRGDVAAPPGDVSLLDVDPGAATIDEAAQAPHDGLLVDVRGPQHYRGTATLADPVGGHIPGAVNLPTVSHLDAQGRLKPPDEILDALARLGPRSGDRIVVYCSSGIASAHSALAFATAGVEADVFAGSWSKWSRTPGRPVAVGATPDGEVWGGWRLAEARG